MISFKISNMSTIEKKACEAYEENRNLPTKYQIGDAMWMDWYTKGYQQAKEDLGIVKIHCLTRKPGDQTFFFTKNEKHCLCIDYKSQWDFGAGSPSGARLDGIEIHTNNSFIFEYIPEISIEDVPKCIIDLLTFLK